jgi:uncharacterized protein (TIGR02246 family)
LALLFFDASDARVVNAIQAGRRRDPRLRGATGLPDPMKMRPAARAALGAIALLSTMAASKPLAAEPAEAAIRQALDDWTRHFNARDSDKICDLFADDLRYDFRGQPERGFADICALLQHSLRDPDRRYSYALRIKEIIVMQDLAIVRLVWTFSASAAGSVQQTVSHEVGLDVFRRQPDGRWKIIRYIAFDE